MVSTSMPTSEIILEILALKLYRWIGVRDKLYVPNSIAIASAQPRPVIDIILWHDCRIKAPSPGYQVAAAFAHLKGYLEFVGKVSKRESVYSGLHSPQSQSCG
ncbi:hypothetical protein TWF718_000053 [Orbilia javanica]|uniref:Uncharacterized protein n=1 Tax=Orbilia javanica TaxID=47235 RepID=A0AAN8N3X3_9PEZI